MTHRCVRPELGEHPHRWAQHFDESYVDDSVAGALALALALALATVRVAALWRLCACVFGGQAKVGIGASVGVACGSGWVGLGRAGSGWVGSGRVGLGWHCGLVFPLPPCLVVIVVGGLSLAMIMMMVMVMAMVMMMAMMVMVMVMAMRVMVMAMRVMVMVVMELMDS